MKKLSWFGAFFVLFVVFATFALAPDAAAQKGGGKSGGKATGQKTAEQTVKKAEQKARDASGENAKAEKKAYQPKKLSAEEMKQWEGGNPPGWSMGEKKGWGEGATPPGSPEMQGKLEQARERIRARIRAHDAAGKASRVESQNEYEGKAVRSIEGAARMGVPVEHAEAAVQKGIDRGMTGEDIEKMTRAMAYGADKGTDYERLGAFMDGKIAEGERGNELATSIYREIDEGQQTPVREETQTQTQTQTQKEPWYKRIFKRR